MSVERYVVGSDPTADLRINNDPYVSARHAVLAYDTVTGVATVRNLGTNAMLIHRGDGDTVFVRHGGEARIHVGDTVVVGRTPIPWKRGDRHPR